MQWCTVHSYQIYRYKKKCIKHPFHLLYLFFSFFTVCVMTAAVVVVNAMFNLSIDSTVGHETRCFLYSVTAFTRRVAVVQTDFLFNKIINCLFFLSAAAVAVVALPK